MTEIKRLTSEYKKKRSQIRRRLKEFGDLYKRGKDEEIFSELCFCLFTPQSKAVWCDKAVKELRSSNLLFDGSSRAIASRLKGLVRFHNNKASYVVAARRVFRNGSGLDVRSKLDAGDILSSRDWLVENIKGLGYKEATHFLRNIGLGKGMAILDVHILRNLKRYRVIAKIPSSMSRKNYLKIEERMRDFSNRIRIPMEELDLLFWSDETGHVFK
ncbi:MAG: N-glycosylase/DNA lyase [Candidatus Omnitrophica bacterium]|nr:N-glycosylase/DNA lyase [Candidatus Omnitrophota bacterium]